LLVAGVNLVCQGSSITLAWLGWLGLARVNREKTWT